MGSILAMAFAAVMAWSFNRARRRGDRRGMVESAVCVIVAVVCAVL